jgi:hypothetical protein
LPASWKERRHRHLLAPGDLHGHHHGTPGGTTPISTVEEGADAILNLAISPDLEGRTGLYFNRQREARADAQAYDADARRQLRELSLRLTGLAETASTRTA